jgi:hypothetical protein
MKASKFLRLKASWEKKEEPILQQPVVEVKEEVVIKQATKITKKKTDEQPIE